MPTYEYRCPKGHEFEVIQRMTDDPVESCEVCGAPVERVFHPVAVHFKGSGFYTTDYARKKAKEAAGDGDSKSDSSESKTSDSKTSDSKTSSDSKDAKKGSDSTKTSASKGGDD